MTNRSETSTITTTPLTDRIERTTMEGRIEFWVQSARAAVVSEDAARVAA
jgi:hypothetical protein